MPLKNLLA